jgi:hypothetical protein
MNPSDYSYCTEETWNIRAHAWPPGYLPANANPAAPPSTAFAVINQGVSMLKQCQ